MQWILLLFLILGMGYLLQLPVLSLAGALVLHLFLLGFILRLWLHAKSQEQILIESLLLSLAGTAVIGLILGNIFSVADLPSRLMMLALAVAGGWMKRKEMENAWNALQTEWSNEKKYMGTILFLSAIPFFLIFLTNPMYSLISDGWWHCSIYNTIKLDGLPPANPWDPNEPLGYPYAYHVYIAYATGGQLNCFSGLNLFDYLATAIAMLGIYALGKETFENKKTATVAALAFLFLSHMGGVVFLYDLIRLLPTLDLDGYLEFLKSVHGPHTYYGHLTFMGSSVIIPFQMATMMAAFHFPLLAGLLYFLFRKNELAVAILLGALVATNPLVGILGAVTTMLFVLASGEWKNILPWIGAALVSLLVTANYIWALLDKTSVVAGELVATQGTRMAVGFLAGYAPLLAWTTLFFIRHPRVLTRTLWASFAGALILAILLVGKTSAYFYTDALVLLAIGSAPLLAEIRWDAKATVKLVLVGALMIPTFLVVGSYSYYKIPLDDEELRAAEWIEANTPREAVFLVEMNLTQPFNLHQYVPVFGERRVYLGDPGLLRTYGEDTAAAMETYRAILERKDATAICGAKEKGIDYVYLNGWELGSPCLQEVHRQGNITMYATS